MSEFVSLGQTTHLDVISQCIALDAKHVVDVGCGDGSLCRQLAEFGARVTGVEPDPVQAQKNSTQPPANDIDLLEGRAENLPLTSKSADAIIFQYSFHHVPSELMKSAIDEAVRVLKPDGILYFAEPLAEGLHHETIRHFHDETYVRGLAEQAIRHYASPQFGNERVLYYNVERRFDDFNHFAEFYGNLSYNEGYSSADVYQEAVRSSFEMARFGNGYRFTTPVRVNCFSA